VEQGLDPNIEVRSAEGGIRMSAVSKKRGAVD
jgi:hypothetical protein